MEYWFEDSSLAAFFDSSLPQPSPLNVAVEAEQWPDASPFVWTDEAHNQYLGYLEAKFVEELYRYVYCTEDVCGNVLLSSSFIDTEADSNVQSSNTGIQIVPETGSSVLLHCQLSSECDDPVPLSLTQACNASPMLEPSMQPSPACTMPTLCKQTRGTASNKKRSSHWRSLKCQEITCSLSEQRDTDIQSTKKAPALRPRKRKQKDFDVDICFADRNEMDQVVPSTYSM